MTMRPHGFADLAPETLARIIADCAAMQSRRPRWVEAIDGQTLWINRQRAVRPPIWDGFPPLTVQLGDDGKVRFA